MKNFFKKLSFVLAVAMVLTSITPATASAAGKTFIYKSGKVSELADGYLLWVGDKGTDLNVMVNGKKNVAGTWKVGNKAIATIDKNGVVTPKANGKTTVRFTAKTGETDTLKITVGTRASSVKPYVSTDTTKTTITELEMTVGESKDIWLSLPVPSAAKKAGSTSSTFVTDTKGYDESILTVKKNTTRKFTFTANKAGETTITIGAGKPSNKFVKTAEIKVVVTEANKELALEVTGSKTLTVVNADKAVTAGAVSVKRGTSSVNVDDVTWDGDKLIITTSAKMSAGTYTVTAGEKSASVEVEDERVAEIIVDNNGDFVGVNSSTNPTKIYVHYTVLNQYKEDITAEATPTWTSSSCSGNITATDPRTGTLEVPLGTGNWNYGTSVYLSGVYTKGTNVVTTQATVKVGLERTVATAEVLGVVSVVDKSVAKNTIPANFKTGKYVLAMKTFDQYGYPSEDILSASYTAITSAFNFVSDNPLFIKELKEPTNNGVVDFITIDGESYAVVELVPGEYVEKGGTANIQIIANKVGTVTKYEISTVDEQILTSFKIGNFTEIFADGETHEIPFTALDQNGEPITKYSILKGQVTLSSSTGGTDDLRLVEQNDGTAKLMLTDRTSGYTWSDNAARDNIDRYVMLTSIITSNGNYSDATIYIKDKAYPATITGLGAGVKDTVIEGGSTTVYLTGWDAFLATYDITKTFTYVDQYGREIADGYTSQPVYDWFHSSIAPKMQVVYNNATAFTLATTTTVAPVANIISGFALTLNATGNTNTTENATMTFSLVAPKSTSDATYEVKGVSTKRISFTLADISQASDFAVSTGTMFVDTNALVSGSAITKDTHAKKISVTAKVNGKAVVVPTLGVAAPTTGNAINTDYYQVEVLTPYYTTGAGVGVAVSNGSIYFKTVVAAPGAGEPVNDSTVSQYGTSDFIDRNTYPGTNLVAINNVVKLTVWDTVNGSNPKAVVYSTLETKTNPVYAATLATWGENQTIKAEHGNITTADLFDLLADDIKDQYGVTLAAKTACNVTISNVVENKDGLYATGINGSSIAVSGNGTIAPSITNAERGDTFTVTFTYSNTIRVSVNVTVGADWKAFSFDTTPFAWE